MKSILLCFVVLILYSCNKDENVKPIPKSTIILPSIGVTAATFVGAYEATLNGTIFKLGSNDIIDHGFIYSTSDINSLTDGTKVSLGSIAQTKGISVKVKNLNKDQKYFVKLFASTADTTVLSSLGSLTTVKTNQWLQWGPKNGTYANNIGGGINFSNTIYFSFKGSLEANSATYIPITVFNTDSYAWTLMTNCPAPVRDGYTSFAIGDTIHLGLGTNYSGGKDQYRRDFWKFNVNTNMWKRGTDFPADLYYPQSFNVNGRGLVIGYDLKLNGYVVYQYIPQLAYWLNLSAPPFANHSIRSLTLFCSTNYGYVLEGFNLGTSVLWRYDPINDKWLMLGAVPASITDGLYYTTSSTTKAYISTTKELWEYDFQSDTWLDRGALPKQPFIFFMFDGKLYIDDPYNIYMYVPE